METEPQDEGMSTKKKIVAGAALGVAVPAAVGVARKLMSSDEGEGDDEGGDGRETSGGRSQGRSATSSTSGSRGSSGRSRSSSSGRSGSTRSTSKGSSTSRARKSASGGSKPRSSGGAKERTKEQLYTQAKRLNIDGRSKMTKAQLERAVARARP
jgi:hypothetical protein